MFRKTITMIVLVLSGSQIAMAMSSLVMKKMALKEYVKLKNSFPNGILRMSPRMMFKSI